MRIFVGGLPPTATKDEIVRLFRQFGADDASVVLPRDRRTRRRKGFAYVEIADEDRARAAIELFASFAIDGKVLTVCAADERPPKRSRRKLALALGFCAACVSVMSAARADQLSTDIGFTLNPIIGGIHESFNDKEHVPPIPIPLLELRERYGPFELDLGGLPPIASVKAFDLRQGHTSTQLSVFEGVVRVWDPLHRFSAGVGQTLYNQSTHYADPIAFGLFGETQFSRVTGITYQAGYDVPFRHGAFEAVFNYSPAMVGIQYTLYDIAYFGGRADPEQADQIDTAVRYVHPVGRRGDVITGLRYINYTARYSGTGILSDRNVGLLLTLGYRTRIGR